MSAPIIATRRRPEAGAVLSLFGARLPIDDDELEWQPATFKWLRGEFGPPAEQLVLPTAKWFPPSSRSGHGRIEDLFGHVKRAAGMGGGPCERRPGAAPRRGRRRG